MSFAKSKLISSTPDYFACSITNSAARLREPANPGLVGSGNYGYISIYYI